MAWWSLPAKDMDGTLMRSAGVGVLATGVDLAFLSILVSGFGVAPQVANLPALVGGLAAQFVGNKYFAFRDRSRALLRQGLLFGVVEAGALALNAGLFHLLVTFSRTPLLAARLVATAAVYFGFSYPIWRRIFGGRPPKKEEGNSSCSS
ncbi:MAG: GtrA family protein [Deltaproteobacteria bacterium]|nr:GtrA family protein [Deltaproteobacteria bacterium]